MNAFLDTLEALGPDLALGITVLLAIGAVAAWFAREPLHRQRIIEATFVASLLFWPIAWTPLARWEPTPPPADVTLVSFTSALERLDVAPSTMNASVPAPLPVKTAAPDAPLHLGARLYLLGAAIALGLISAGAWRLARVLARARRAPPQLTRLVDEEHDKLTAGANRSPPRLLVAADDRHAPFCTGLLRGIIVIPPRVAATSPNSLRPVLRHELAHVVAADTLGRWLGAIAMPLLWCHPLFWLLRHQHAEAVELVADDRAASADQRERVAYVRGLLALAEAPVGPALLGTNSIFGSTPAFTRRMTMLLAPRSRSFATRCSTSRRLLIGACATLALTATGGMLGATPPQEAPAVSTIKARPTLQHQANTQLEQKRRDLVVAQMQLDVLTTKLRDSQQADATDEQAQRDLLDAQVQLDVLTTELSNLQTSLDRQVDTSVNLYTVKKGDTLRSIVQRHGLPVQAVDRVIAANDIKAPTRLAVGQKLKLPFGVTRSIQTTSVPAPLRVQVAPVAKPAQRSRLTTDERDALAALGYLPAPATPAKREKLEALGYLPAPAAPGQLQKLEALGYVQAPAPPETRQRLEALGYLPAPTAPRTRSTPAPIAPAPIAPAPAASSPASSVVSGELLDLALQYVDARDEIAHLAPLVDQSIASARELRRWERRVSLLKSILTTELEATRLELERVLEGPGAYRVRLEGRLTLLHSVLDN